jgi:beta-lactam-binding protein with PASTA domain
MALGTRMWSAGKVLVLIGALAATYLIFATASMRMAFRAREVHVPDLTNRTANEATAMAAAVGLGVRVDDNRRPDPRIGVDRVRAQDPAAGSTLRRQRSVKVWLSAGTSATTVPQLTGEPQRAAESRLAQDGLQLRAVSEIRSQNWASDVVVGQEPPAAAAAESAGVTLLVNRAELGAGYVMPDLIGVNGDRASEILRGQGFRVAVVGAAPYPGVPSGIVLRQAPRAGFQIAPGEAISIEVSR